MTIAAADETYTIAICKGSALLGETKALLRAWEPGESLDSFAQRVLKTDVLGKTTAYRTRDIVRRMFARRFLRPSGQAARTLKRLIEARTADGWFSDLCLLMAARADALLRDFVTEFYWPALAEGRIRMSVESAVAFLAEAQRSGRMAEPWSEQVRLKVARGLLKALTDFGLLREVGRGLRETVVYRPSLLAVAYLSYDLHFKGLTDGAVADHPDWRLFGLRRSEVLEALDRVSSPGLLTAQSAGAVVRITWRHARMEEVVDVLARLDLR